MILWVLLVWNIRSWLIICNLVGISLIWNLMIKQESQQVFAIKIRQEWNIIIIMEEKIGRDYSFCLKNPHYFEDFLKFFLSQTRSLVSNE